MNRMQFIQTIMELYPNTFRPDNEKQFRGWVNRYKKALPEDWDFDIVGKDEMRPFRQWLREEGDLEMPGN